MYYFLLMFFVFLYENLSWIHLVKALDKRWTNRDKYIFFFTFPEKLSLGYSLKLLMRTPNIFSWRYRKVLILLSEQKPPFLELYELHNDALILCAVIRSNMVYSGISLEPSKWLKWASRTNFVMKEYVELQLEEKSFFFLFLHNNLHGILLFWTIQNIKGKKWKKTHRTGFGLCAIQSHAHLYNSKYHI